MAVSYFLASSASAQAEHMANNGIVYLDIAHHVVLDWREGNGAKNVYGQSAKRSRHQRHYIPNRLQRDSDASRKSVVGMALSLLVSIGTSANDFLRLLKNVGLVVVAMFTHCNIKMA